jgi:hypothetical protein
LKRQARARRASTADAQAPRFAQADDSRRDRQKTGNLRHASEDPENEAGHGSGIAGLF